MLLDLAVQIVLFVFCHSPFVRRDITFDSVTSVIIPKQWSFEPEPNLNNACSNGLERLRSDLPVLPCNYDIVAEQFVVMMFEFEWTIMFRYANNVPSTFHGLRRELVFGRLEMALDVSASGEASKLSGVLKGLRRIPFRLPSKEDMRQSIPLMVRVGPDVQPRKALLDAEGNGVII